MKIGQQRGFSLMELMVAMAILMVIVGAVFQLLSQSQQRRVSTTSAEEITAMSRDALEQMIREIRLAGYPAPNSYPAGVITPANSRLDYVAGAFVGGTLVGGGFLLPNELNGIPASVPPGFTIQFEADVDNNGDVEVIAYHLQVPTGGDTGGCANLQENANLTTPTLMRSEVRKSPDGAPMTPVFQPFLENVQNCLLHSVADPHPIFVLCPAPTNPPGAAVAGCPDMTMLKVSSLPAPRNTRIVMIRLQVQTPIRDPQTGQFQNIEQFGLADRVNPDR